MSKSRLLPLHYSDNEGSEEEEFTLNPVSDSSFHENGQDVRYLNTSYTQRQRPYFQTTDTSSQSNDEEEEEEDMEAPPSLILDRNAAAYNQQQQQQPFLPTTTTTTTTHTTYPYTANKTSSAISTREHVTTYDRTMWRWANVENMDDFFSRVYEYYQGKGIYCILLARFLNLL